MAPPSTGSPVPACRMISAAVLYIVCLYQLVPLLFDHRPDETGGNLRMELYRQHFIALYGMPG